MNQTLPQARKAIEGRTHASTWNPARYGAAIEKHQRRARVADRLYWIASAILFAATFCMVYAPGVLSCFGIAANP